MGALVFFAANDAVHGYELWVTDGTQAGTRLVKDINPNTTTLEAFRGSRPQELEPLGDGRVVFRAEDDIFGGRTELWVSDGTEAGTAMVKNIGGSESSDPSGMAQVSPGLVVFHADDHVNGRELWVTDGTSDGTRLLKDINPGAGSAFDAPSDSYGTQEYWPKFVSLGNGHVVFFANDGAHGFEPWVTDGTSEGTRLLKDLMAGQADSRVSLTDFFWKMDGSRAVFVADDGTHGEEIWVTDGTAGGTQLLKDINEGSADAAPRSMDPQPDGSLLFIATDSAGTARQYWTDGTSAGTDSETGSPQTDADIPSPVLGQNNLASIASNAAQLPDGRLLFEGTYEHHYTDNDGEPAVSYYSDLLWVAGSGSQDLVVPFDDTLSGQVTVTSEFTRLPDGRLIFSAYDGYWYGATESLHISDGTAGGTGVFSADVVGVSGTLEFANGWMLVIAEDRNGDDGLYATNGTSFQFISDQVSSFSSIVGDPTTGGDQLFSVLRGVVQLEPGGPYSAVHDLWVSDGTPGGTRMVSANFEPLNVRKVEQINADQMILGYYESGDGKSVEPWLVDFNGGLQPLGDLKEGAVSSDPQYLTRVIPLDEIPIPVSTLFPVRISLEEEESSFDLDDYFSDPEDSPLTYSVAGLPEDIAVDSLTNVMATAADVEAGEHEITITARNPAGGEVTSDLTWSVLDTGQLKLSTTGEWGRESDAAPYQSTPGTVLTVGLKDGTQALFRVEELDPTKPVAKVDGTKLTLEGKLFSTQVPTLQPLMEGKFTLDMATLAVTNFADANSNSDFRLLDGLVDFTFADISLRSDSIAFRTDLAFDDGGGSGPSYNALTTSNAPLAVVFGADGLDFEVSAGTERWSPDPIEFDLGGGSTMSVGFSDLGIDYEAGTQDLYINGKATVGWGGALENGFSFVGNDSETTLTIDLFGTAQQTNFFTRGDKYLKISNGSSGWDWDVVGEIKYEDKYSGPVPAKGFLVKELLVTFDTIKNEYNGAFKANIPLLFGLDLSASLGFVQNPDLTLDKISVGLDGLDYPLGTTGLFVQGGTLGLENLAAADPTSGYTYKAEIRGTFGPDNALIKSPLHGSISGAIKETTDGKKTGYEMTGTVAMDSKVGYLLTDTINVIAHPLIDYFGVAAADVTNFELIKANSTTTLNLVKDRAQYDASIELLGGVVKGAAQLISAPHKEIKNAQVLSGSIGASLVIPDDFPLVGGMTRSGNAIFTYSSDGISENDLAAFWSQITIPLGFTSRVYAFGAELKFDGSYRFLGRKDIPKISSWALEPEDETVILTARWENDAADVSVELITPAGLVLTEADIATLDWVTLVADLNTGTGRHLALSAPEAGVWDLRVTDATGLGLVSYEANRMLASASAQIASVTPDVAAHQADVVIEVDTGGAPEAQITIFAAPNAGAVAGITLAQVTVDAGAGPVTQTIDYDDLGPGAWHIYTRTDAEARAPLVQAHPTPIVIEGAADLTASARQASFGPSGAQVMTVEVRNEGNRTSEPGLVTVIVPPAMQGADPVPELEADPLNASETDFDLPALAPGESFTLRISLPAGSEDLADAVQVQTWTPGYDADLTDNRLGQVLYADSFDLIDQFLEGSGIVDILRGNAGSDTLLGQEGDDFLLPGAGPDTVEGGAGTSDLLGLGYHTGPLPDQPADIDLGAELANNDGFGFTDIVQDVEDILGTKFGDRLIGNGFANFLFGGEGHDTIDGLGGSDVIWGGPGADLLEGGAGHDYLAFPSAASFLFSDDFHMTFPTLHFGTLGVTVDLAAGTATDSFGDTDVATGFESVIGTRFADDISGTEEDNYLSGDAGNDRLIGLGGDDSVEGAAGDDTLSGGAGDDRLVGGAGSDSISGGAGVDEVSYRDAPAGVTVNLDLGVASADGFGTGDLLDGIEEITGSEFADLLTGDAGDNTFTGLGGNDTFVGGAGQDDLIYAFASGGVTVDMTSGTAHGADGDDTFSGIEWVTGSFHADLIIGDGSGNILAGLDGADTIRGGGDTDVLMGGAGDDELDGGAGGDLAFFFGDQESFTLTLSTTETFITDRRAAGEGTDRLVSIELLDFSENIELFGTDPMPLLLFDGPTGLSAPEFSAIIELYIAYFNRAPDALGLSYWATQFANGYSVPEMAASFFRQPETQSTYAAVLDETGNLNVTDAAKVGDFVTAVYNNVLGRSPDAPGFDYWVGELTNNPHITPGVFILAIIGGAKNPGNPTPQTAIDQAYLATKSDLGAYFAVIRGMSDIEDATASMALFDGSDASRDATVATIDGHYADALDPETGDFLMPLVGVIDNPFEMV